MDNIIQKLQNYNKKILLKFNEPVITYKIEEPNKIKPEAIEPKIKYFKAASTDKIDFFWEAVKI